MEINLQYFIVTLQCRSGQFARVMTSGIRENRKFMHSEDRNKAQRFSKFAAESLVETLKTKYRLTAQVEPAAEKAPYAR